MKKLVLLGLAVFLASPNSFASLSDSALEDSIVHDPRVSDVEIEVFVVDEEEWGVDLRSMSDEELFGEEGLIHQMIEFEQEAGLKKQNPTRKPRARSRSCAAPASGGASYYAEQFHGRKTANGERFNMNALTAAHKTLAFNSLVRVTYRGKSVVVRINDAGPYAGGRVIDLSKAAAQKIGMIRAGHGKVTLSLVRCGSRGKNIKG